MKKINDKSLILLIVFFSLFVLLSILVVNDMTLKFDNAICNFVLDIRNSFLTNFFKVTTNLSGNYFLILFTFLCYFIIKDKKICHMILLNLIFASSINALVKMIFCRPRPEIMIILENDYSYPSGHSMVSFSFYIFLTYLVFNYVKEKNLKKTLIILLPLIVIIVGASRIYLGAHYFTDVLGGFLLGSIYLTIYIMIVKKGIIEK